MGADRPVTLAAIVGDVRQSACGVDGEILRIGGIAGGEEQVGHGRGFGQAAQGIKAVGPALGGKNQAAVDHIDDTTIGDGVLHRPWRGGIAKIPRSVGRPGAPEVIAAIRRAGAEVVGAI